MQDKICNNNSTWKKEAKQQHMFITQWRKTATNSKTQSRATTKDTEYGQGKQGNNYTLTIFETKTSIYKLYWQHLNIKDNRSLHGTIIYKTQCHTCTLPPHYNTIIKQNRDT